MAKDFFAQPSVPSANSNLDKLNQFDSRLISVLRRINDVNLRSHQIVSKYDEDLRVFFHVFSKMSPDNLNELFSIIKREFPYFKDFESDFREWYALQVHLKRQQAIYSKCISDITGESL